MAAQGSCERHEFHRTHGLAKASLESRPQGRHPVLGTGQSGHRDGRQPLAPWHRSAAQSSHQLKTVAAGQPEIGHHQVNG